MTDTQHEAVAERTRIAELETKIGIRVYEDSFSEFGKGHPDFRDVRLHDTDSSTLDLQGRERANVIARRKIHRDLTVPILLERLFADKEAYSSVSNMIEWLDHQFGVVPTGIDVGSFAKQMESAANAEAVALVSSPEDLFNFLDVTVIPSERTANPGLHALLTAAPPTTGTMVDCSVNKIPHWEVGRTFGEGAAKEIYKDAGFEVGPGVTLKNGVERPMHKAYCDFTIKSSSDDAMLEMESKYSSLAVWYDNTNTCWRLLLRWAEISVGLHHRLVLSAALSHCVIIIETTLDCRGE